MYCALLNHFSHVRLFATPWTTARQAPLSMGFSRQEYWSGLPFVLNRFNKNFSLLFKILYIAFSPKKKNGKSVLFHFDYKHFSDTCFVSDVQKLLFRENKLYIIAFVHNNETMNPCNSFACVSNPNIHIPNIFISS